MKRTLAKYLVCPKCGLAVDGISFGDSEEIMLGRLQCDNGHFFQVNRGVPRMVSVDGLTRAQQQTSDSFASKWKTIPDYGYDETSDSFRTRWYMDRYGWTQSEFAEFMNSRCMVLDAGTGLGSLAKIYADMTGGQVFGVDISECIDGAFEHAGQINNLHLIQADLTCLPFKRGQFDFIASDQVLHHTPNTEKSFKYLCQFLAPGGQIAVYVYKKKAVLRELVDDYIRNITTRMTIDACTEFCEQMALLGKALTEMKAVVNVEKDIPILGIKAGKQDAQRFVYWNLLKCFWNPDFDLKTNVMVNVDWYHPAYAWRHTPGEVEGWFRDEGLKIVFEKVEESGISVRGQK